MEPKLGAMRWLVSRLSKKHKRERSRATKPYPPSSPASAARLAVSAATMRSLYVLVAVCTCLLVGSVDGRQMTKHKLREKQLEALKRWAPPYSDSEPGLEKRGGVKNITFTNPRASGEHGPALCC